MCALFIVLYSESCFEAFHSSYVLHLADLSHISGLLLFFVPFGVAPYLSVASQRVVSFLFSFSEAPSSPHPPNPTSCYPLQNNVPCIYIAVTLTL